MLILCGFDDESATALLQQAGNPLAFAGTAPVPADMLALLAALRADTQAQRK